MCEPWAGQERCVFVQWSDHMDHCTTFPSLLPIISISLSFLSPSLSKEKGSPQCFVFDCRVAESCTVFIYTPTEPTATYLFQQSCNHSDSLLTGLRTNWLKKTNIKWFYRCFWNKINNTILKSNQKGLEQILFIFLLVSDLLSSQTRHVFCKWRW